jgi:hypothetical protein
MTFYDMFYDIHESCVKRSILSIASYRKRVYTVDKKRNNACTFQKVCAFTLRFSLPAKWVKDGAFYHNWNK